jgi:hypothetical protein
MIAAIKLGQSELDDCRVVCDIGPQALTSVIQRLRRMRPAPISPKRLTDIIAEELVDKNAAAENLVRLAILAHAWARGTNSNVSDMPVAVLAAVAQSSAWTEDDARKWDKIAKLLAEFLSLPILHLVIRAVDLSYEYTNLWGNARIITDIRPIFTDDASTIDGAVVSHACRLQFLCADGQHELNIAMDESDVRDLAEQCDRALRKAETARHLMNDIAGVPTTVPGGETDDA